MRRGRNSLPELVTAIAAVRIGAVNRAVGDLIGGNSDEVSFLAAADFFYRPGSIDHEFDVDNVFIAVLAILLSGVLLLGMLPRQRHRSAGSGFESAPVARSCCRSSEPRQTHRPKAR